MPKQLHRILLFFFVLLVAVACRQGPPLTAENVNLDITVTDLLVGQTDLVVSVTDSQDNPVEDPGSLTLRGDMDHAGMVPVLAENITDSEDGVFTVPFEWTMGGAWTVEATLTLPNDEVVVETFTYEILSEATDEDVEGLDTETDEDASASSAEATEESDTAEMDTSGDDEESDTVTSERDLAVMDMGGETSAVYMQISNIGEDAVTITGASTSVAGIVEIHETVIEDDVASMEPVTAIVVDAGETVELRPGGMHIMLMELTEDIEVEDTIELELMLESGDTLTLSAVAQEMLMEDRDTEVEVGDLLITNIWVRPAGASTDMESNDDMDAEATEEAEMDESDADDEMDESEDSADMDSDAPSRWEQMVETTDLIGSNPMDMDEIDSDDSDMSDTAESSDMDMDTDATDEDEMEETEDNTDDEDTGDTSTNNTVTLWQTLVNTQNQ